MKAVALRHRAFFGKSPDVPVGGERVEDRESMA